MQATIRTAKEAIGCPAEKPLLEAVSKLLDDAIAADERTSEAILAAGEREAELTAALAKAERDHIYYYCQLLRVEAIGWQAIIQRDASSAIAIENAKVGMAHADRADAADERCDVHYNRLGEVAKERDAAEQRALHFAELGAALLRNACEIADCEDLRDRPVRQEHANLCASGHCASARGDQRWARLAVYRRIDRAR